MRNWEHHDLYLNKLAGDIYPQPEGNDNHPALTKKVVDHWLSRLTGCKNVLDVGCGTGFAEDFFKSWNVEYEGVCLGEDYLVAKRKDRNVKNMDFSFLDYYLDNSFDLIFSRHSLEHSPFPLLTLMEWARVSKQWLGLVVPSPEWYGYVGRNHYYVLNSEQWKNLLENAGWNVIWNEVDKLPRDERFPDDLTPHELWLFAEKKR